MLTTYKEFVDYELLDAFKQKMLDLLDKTSGFIGHLGIRLVPESVGEAAALFDFGDFYLAFKSDGVGTKNLIADQMAYSEGYPWSFYGRLAQDLVAMNVNDLLCVGATPFALSDEVASGSKEWFKNEDRLDEIVSGFEVGCAQAGIVVPCGETPTLPGIIDPATVSITGSSLGIVRPKSRALLGDRIIPGDIVYGLASNGIHANGLSLARAVAKLLPHGYETLVPGYETELPPGQNRLGQLLLTPTRIYVPEITSMFERGVELHYLTNITGGALQK